MDRFERSDLCTIEMAPPVFVDMLARLWLAASVSASLCLFAFFYFFIGVLLLSRFFLGSLMRTFSMASRRFISASSVMRSCSFCSGVLLACSSSRSRCSRLYL